MDGLPQRSRAPALSASNERKDLIVDIAKIKEQLYRDPEVLDLIRHKAFEIFLHRHHNGWPGSQAEDWMHAENQVLPRLIDEMITRDSKAIDSQAKSSPFARAAAEQERKGLKPANEAPIQEPTTELPPSAAVAAAPVQTEQKPARPKKAAAPKAAPTDKPASTRKRTTKKAVEAVAEPAETVKPKPAARKAATPETPEKKAAAPKAAPKSASQSASKKPADATPKKKAPSKARTSKAPE